MKPIYIITIKPKNEPQKLIEVVPEYEKVIEKMYNNIYAGERIQPSERVKLEKCFCSFSEVIKNTILELFFDLKRLLLVLKEQEEDGVFLIVTAEGFSNIFTHCIVRSDWLFSGEPDFIPLSEKDLKVIIDDMCEITSTEHVWMMCNLFSHTVHQNFLRVNKDLINHDEAFYEIGENDVFTYLPKMMSEYQNRTYVSKRQKIDFLEKINPPKNEGNPITPLNYRIYGNEQSITTPIFHPTNKPIRCSICSDTELLITSHTNGSDITIVQAATLEFGASSALRLSVLKTMKEGDILVYVDSNRSKQTSVTTKSNAKKTVAWPTVGNEDANNVIAESDFKIEIFKSTREIHEEKRDVCWSSDKKKLNEEKMPENEEIVVSTLSYTTPKKDS